MKTDIQKRIQGDLQKYSDTKTRESVHHFFKEPVVSYGVKSKIVTDLAKKYWKEIKNESKKDIFKLCENLFKSNYMEESFIASDFSYNMHKQFEETDMATFEPWIKTYINNWAKCDVFCNHTIGTFIEMYPQYIKTLFSWTKSKNRWVKRASAVALIIPARHGKFLNDVFTIADNLLTDPDDLVQKGYGWMLKATSQTHQKEVFDYVMKHKKEMPRTALRYAIEKMPENLRKKAMTL